MLRVMLRCSVAALLIAGAAGFLYFGADVDPRRALEANESSTILLDLDDTSPTNEELDYRLQIFLRRTAVRDQVVQELLARRLTLLQAGARFRDLDKEIPLTWCSTNSPTGPAEGERLCRLVIDRAKVRVQMTLPALSADVTARLEAELERHRDKDGVVRLPD